MASYRSSENLRKSGVYLQPQKEPIELLHQSSEAQRDFDGECVEGVNHKAGIWPFDEDVKEMTVHADTYDMTITLLLFPRHGLQQFNRDEDEPEPYDS